MAWWKRRDGEGESGSVEIARVGHGVLVSGDEDSVASFGERLKDLAGGVQQFLPDGMAVLGAAVGFVQTHRRYFQFSPRAMELLDTHDWIPTVDGYFRSFVRNGQLFDGNLDWVPVNLVPEQALSFQMMTSQVALRAAIKEVQAAIERVESKVDELVKLARAERLGAAVGDQLTLRRLVDRVAESGRITQTDWSTVAPLGPVITRDVAALRSHIEQSIGDVELSKRARSRADEVEELAREMVIESIDLLVIAESNLALWHQLRLAYAVTFERDAALEIAADVQSQLLEARAIDQRLLDSVDATVDALLAPTGFEGFAPMQKRRLRAFGNELGVAATRFAEQRQLDLDTEEVKYPGLGASVVKVGETVTEALRSTTKAIASNSHQAVERLHGRSRESTADARSSEVPELGTTEADPTG